LDLDQLDVLVIENVGNLVCPADYDLGEDLRVVLLSVTEGEDKPLKYPPMFHSAHVAVVTKSDMAAAAGFNRELALQNLERVSHHARIFELSAKTGDGMKAWLDFLVPGEKRANFGTAQPLWKPATVRTAIGTGRFSCCCNGGLSTSLCRYRRKNLARPGSGAHPSIFRRWSTRYLEWYFSAIRFSHAF
jgi:hypothetical protein